MRKVTRGDPLRIPAGTYNAFIDAAADYQRRQANVGGEASRGIRLSGILPVKNATGTDLDRFSVVGIGGPLYSPADSLDSFKFQLVLSGVVPSGADHKGRFAVLLEPVKAGQIGAGLVSGVCQVKVSVGDEAHACAEIVDATTSCLGSSAKGGARILWKEGGTGLKWALVRLESPLLRFAFVGEIVAQGPDEEPDFTDARYWVKQQSITQAAGGALEFSASGYWGGATNLAEYDDRTHNLSAGQKVAVLIVDRADGEPVYVFSEYAGGDGGGDYIVSVDPGDPAPDVLNAKLVDYTGPTADHVPVDIYQAAEHDPLMARVAKQDIRSAIGMDVADVAIHYKGTNSVAISLAGGNWLPYQLVGWIRTGRTLASMLALAAGSAETSAKVWPSQEAGPNPPVAKVTNGSFGGSSPFSGIWIDATADGLFLRIEHWNEWPFWGEWDIGEPYDTGDVVEHLGTYWQANQDTNAGDEPGVSGKWDAYEMPETWVHARVCAFGATPDDDESYTQSGNVFGP